RLTVHGASIALRLPQRALAERAVEGGSHTVFAELSLAAEEIDDGRDIGFAERDVVVVGHVRVRVDPTDLFDVAQSVDDLGRHALDAAVLLNQLERLLRSDPLDAFVEVGANENAEIDQLPARDAVGLEQSIELDDLRHDRARDTLTGQEFLAGDGQE